MTEDPHRPWFRRQRNAAATSARGRPITRFINPLCTSGTPGCNNGIQDNLSARPQFSYNGKLNVIDPSLISPVATALLNYIPLPLPALENAPGYQLGNPNYAASGDEIYHADALDVRADYFYSDKLRLFDRYTFTQFHKEAPGLFGGAAGGPQLNPIGYTGSGRHAAAKQLVWRLLRDQAKPADGCSLWLVQAAHQCESPGQRRFCYPGGGARAEHSRRSHHQQHAPLLDS